MPNSTPLQRKLVYYLLLPINPFSFAMANPTRYHPIALSEYETITIYQNGTQVTIPEGLAALTYTLNISGEIHLSRKPYRHQR